MSLRFLLIFFLLGTFEVSLSKNPTTASYDLCKLGSDVTALSGNITASLGKDCSKVIFAPKGYRIEVNITEHTRIQEEKPMYIFDGATRFDNVNSVRITRHRVHENRIIISSSNAVFIHIDKISSKLTNVEIIYKMFRQPPERCACLPVTHGTSICSFFTQFIRDDSLTRQCSVDCGRDRFIPNRFISSNFKMSCFLGDPEHNDQGTWKPVEYLDRFTDDQLITCSRIYPATRLKAEYKFTYNNASCGQVNETAFKNEIRQYISTVESVVNASQCFKSLYPKRNENCTVESVAINCTTIDQSAQVTLTIRDNIINSRNETIAFQRYFRLHSAYDADIMRQGRLDTFITSNLTVDSVKPTGIPHLYPRRPTEDCPRNAAFKIDHKSSKYGCLNCPPHFYDVENLFTSCKECQNGTRRNINETTCVKGPRNYPEPSLEYCKHTCDLGKYFNPNSSICEWCPYGTYQNSTTAFNPQCSPCPTDLTTGFIGARNISECISLCPAGSFLKYTRCFECDIGYFMPNTSNKLPKCYKCPTGYTTLDVGTIEGCVKNCTVGEYFNMTLQNCTLCPNNTYQDEVNDTNTRSCKKCPQNTTTATIGSTTSMDCLGPCTTGQYIDINSKECSPCDLHTYQDEMQHLRFTCKSCGPNKITLKTGSTNVSDCIYRCQKAEFFNLTSSRCEECPVNSYQDELGRDTCKSCQGNALTVKTGSENCISPCGYGEFLNKSLEKCIKCSKGSFQNMSEYTLEFCHPCQKDFYSDKAGERNCTSCKDGSITLIGGATNEDECIETCQPGYYLNKTLRSCQKCSKGFYQDNVRYEDEFCIKCDSSNLTTLGTGASSAEECVGFCTSLPCLNGAICTNIENDFNCSCPQFLTGKRCEIITDKNDVDTMEISIRFLDLVWNVSVGNPDSDEFKILAASVENSIRAEFENDTTFRTVKVVGFRQGSVIGDVVFNYVGGVIFVTPVDKLKTVISDGSLGNFTVDKSSVIITNYTCSQPLGMENRRIPDSAITSGFPRFYHPPKSARLHHSGPGWAPLATFGSGIYLQVDFLEEVWFTGIATQGSSYDGGSWLNAFYIQTSLNGQDWSDYVGEFVDKHIFAANSDRDTVVHNSLPYPVKTRYVRIFAHDFEKWISFRVEFYGCPIPKTVPLPTLIPTSPINRSTSQTSKPRPTSESTAVTSDDGDVGLIVGVTLGVIAVCVVVVVLVVWGTKRNKQSLSVGSSFNAIQLKDTSS